MDGEGTVSEAPAIIDAPLGLKLDLGCGLRPKEGFDGVDIASPAAKYRVDLTKFPWPWPTASADEIYSSHFVEHLDARLVVPSDISLTGNAEEDERRRIMYIGQDLLLAFFDECYRILKPEGSMLCIFPCARSDGAFQDPTHRRFLNQNTMAYLSKKGREDLSVSHYKVRCDFDSDIQSAGPMQFINRHEDVQRLAYNHYWNTVWELHATLKPK